MRGKIVRKSWVIETKTQKSLTSYRHEQTRPHGEDEIYCQLKQTWMVRKVDKNQDLCPCPWVWDGISLDDDGPPFSPWHSGAVQAPGSAALRPGLAVCWCLALPDALAVPGGSCFMSLIADGYLSDRHEAPACFSALRQKGVLRVFPACVWRGLAGAGLWDQVTNHL